MNHRQRPSSAGAAPRLAAILIGVLVGLYLAREILIPLAFAITLALMLSPAVGWLERLHIRRVPAVVGVMIVALTISAGVSYVIFNELVRVASDLPGYRERIHKKLVALRLPNEGSLGRVAQSVTELGKELVNAPDPPSRLTSANNPESGTTQYTYDKDGNLSTRTDARGVVLTMASYDNAGRPTLKSYTGDPTSTPAVRYCYDGGDYDAATGTCTGSAVVSKRMQLTAVGSSVSVTRYDQFDNLERVTKSSQASGNVSYPFEYQYQLDGTLKQFQYPSGRVVSYGFDTAGRVNAIPGYLTAVSYSDHGAVRRVSYANGILEQRCYNERLQAVRITVKAVLADQCFASYHMAFSF